MSTQQRVINQLKEDLASSNDTVITKALTKTRSKGNEYLIDPLIELYKTTKNSKIKEEIKRTTSITGKTRMTAAGTTTAALAVGGAPPPGSYANTSLEYNGSSWTAVTATPYTTSSNSGIGLQTAALNIGGEPSFRNNVSDFLNSTPQFSNIKVDL